MLTDSFSEFSYDFLTYLLLFSLKMVFIIFSEYFLSFLLRNNIEIQPCSCCLYFNWNSTKKPFYPEITIIRYERIFEL